MPRTTVTRRKGKTFRRKGMMPWDMFFDTYIETTIITIAK